MKHLLYILFLLTILFTNVRHEIDFVYPFNLKDIKKVCGNSIYPRYSERDIIYPLNFQPKKSFKKNK